LRLFHETERKRLTKNHIVVSIFVIVTISIVVVLLIIFTWLSSRARGGGRR
jgi:hypothetical protein